MDDIAKFYIKDCSIEDCSICNGNGFLEVPDKEKEAKETKEIMCEPCTGNGFLYKENIWQ
ncbi:MAG: hypothetical protein WAQ98_11280 [Blastocatellia bacterium]